jgi:hypothetical protein
VKLLDSFLTLQIPDDARSDIFGVLKNIENSEDNVYRLQLIEQLQAITSAYQ